MRTTQIKLSSDSSNNRLCVSAALVLMLAACGGSLDLHSNVTESEANEMVAALTERGVNAHKSPVKGGFAVSVSERDLAAAVSVLRQRGLPRKSYSGFGNAFPQDKMIQTPAEERARYIYAISQELENTLSQLDGVVVARVHPVLPDRAGPGGLVQPASCAVFIKHRVGWDSGAYEARIRQLVATSIPGLSDVPQSAIAVVFVPDGDEGAPGEGTIRPNSAVDKPERLERFAIWGALCAGLALVGGALAWWLLRNGKQRSVRNNLKPE